MRSQKLFVAGATILTSLSVAGLSFADPPLTSPTTTATPTTEIDSQTVMTPSVPSVPAAGSPATTPTSTTTTTGADTEGPVTTTYTPPPRESTVITTRRRPNKAVLITGGALFVGTYATTAGITAGVNAKEDHDLYLPVVGPWINLANRSCEGDCTATHNRNTALIAGSGVLQGIGAGMVLASFFIPEKVASATIAAGPVKMQVVPTAGGLGAVGTF